jgi:glycosyltransferase involved in cell wall biosynthesis
VNGGQNRTLREPHSYALIIPALNEAESLGILLAQIPWQSFAQVIVVDNGSQDATAEAARRGGAKVCREPRRGYGQACQAGLAALRDGVTAVVFMDADLSDDPADLLPLLARFEEENLDLLIGSRVLGGAAPGSLTSLQQFGNWLSTRLIRLMWGVSFTDLGPLRVVRRQALAKLALRDRDFGWNIEMQAQAARLKLRTGEMPVCYRCRRFGQSKISGPALNSLRAGCKILWTLFRCWRLPRIPEGGSEDASGT